METISDLDMELASIETAYESGGITKATAADEYRVLLQKADNLPDRVAIIKSAALYKIEL